MIILDGKKLQNEISLKLIKKIKKFSIKTSLAIIQIGNNKSSNLYVKNKINFGKKIGIDVIHYKIKETSNTKEVCELIEKLNSDKNVSGIIVQMPFPKKLDQNIIFNSIKKEKDVDGLSALNIYDLVKNEKKAIIPATARGIITLLQENSIEIQGKKIAIIGRSVLVGKSTALALLNKDATVFICHSKTKNLKEITKMSDIIIVAVGKKGFIDDSFLSKNQIVIDVGINVFDNKIFGDVEIVKKDKIYAMSPVPGGVGPMTVVSLFQNLIDSYFLQNNIQK